LNQIGAEGARHLSHARQKNTVRFNSLLHFHQTQLLYFLQTLTQPNLGGNEIGGEGVTASDLQNGHESQSRVNMTRTTLKKFL